VQPSTLRDYDDRDMFCLFLLPGNNENRKVVVLTWVSLCFLNIMNQIFSGYNLMVKNGWLSFH
jgi:hypothetical protein